MTREHARSQEAGDDHLRLRQRVRDFWDRAPCGEAYAQGGSLREKLEAQATTRYQLEPYLHGFARFEEGKGVDVLEIGVGMGADHLEWARSAPRSLTGIDLTAHRRSLVGAMLWLRYGLLAVRPWRRLDDVYAQHLESPGTKAYSPAEAQALFAGFSDVRVRAQLGPGDLLLGAVGQRHRGALLQVARRIYPRWAVRWFLANHGLYLLIEARRGR